MVFVCASLIAISPEAFPPVHRLCNDALQGRAERCGFRPARFLPGPSSLSSPLKIKSPIEAQYGLFAHSAKVGCRFAIHCNSRHRAVSSR